jgi:hypothetical protein
MELTWSSSIPIKGVRIGGIDGAMDTPRLLLVPMLPRYFRIVEVNSLRVESALLYATCLAVRFSCVVILKASIYFFCYVVKGGFSVDVYLVLCPFDAFLSEISVIL